jgi:hypothetical protein
LKRKKKSRGILTNCFKIIPERLWGNHDLSLDGKHLFLPAEEEGRLTFSESKPIKINTAIANQNRGRRMEGVV